VEPGNPAAAPRRTLRPRLWQLGTAALLVLLVLLAAWKWWSPGPRARPPGSGSRSTDGDPRLTFATPYRNVRPDVKYVGDAACADCHAGKTRTYRQHPMGQSLALVSAASPLEHYDEAAHNPFQVSGFRYQVEREAGRVLHRETAVNPDGPPFTDLAAEVTYAVGSGQRGRAYLIDHDGYLFASPLTWYPTKNIWDLSPGYEKRNPRFTRPITPDCLFCHCNQAEHLADTVNRYRPPIFQGQVQKGVRPRDFRGSDPFLNLAIGCERCHGPGELHVRRRQANEEVAGVDDTIVNPGRLEPPLREAVCQQCHLQGQQRILRRGRETFDYRPGLPLHLFLSDFVRKPEYAEDNKFVGAVEQMYASRCFQASAGEAKLGCISCHDPHERPDSAEKVVYYRERCLNCHQEREGEAPAEPGARVSAGALPSRSKQRGCSVPAAVRRATNPDDSCIACHMPSTGSTINHTAIVDHRVPRRPEPTRPPAPLGLRLEQIPFLPFHPDLAGPEDEEVARGLGIALTETADSQPEARARQLAAWALPLLEAALASDPKDPSAWEARGNALWFLGRLEEALTAYEKALEQAPQREVTLARAASLTLRLNRLAAARSYEERAIAVNPWNASYHLDLAKVHARGRDWHAAAVECERALQLNPAQLTARSLLVTCYAQQGERDRAQAAFQTLAGLSPPGQQEALRRWFAEQAP
jgi:Flp pilus assembly protein TadD